MSVQYIICEDIISLLHCLFLQQLDEMYKLHTGEAAAVKQQTQLIYYKNITVFIQNCYIFTPMGHHQAGMSERSAVNN